MVLVKSESTDVFNNVFIFYDFKQVKDMIMIVTYLEQSKQWEKIFIFNKDSRWQTDELQDYLSEEKYKWTFEKLTEIFNEPQDNSDFKDLDIEKIRKEFPFFSSVVEKA